MAFQYFITKDEYVTGPLDTDVKAVNPVREEVVYAVVDTLDSEESGALANPKRPIYKSVRPNAKGIYITDDADAQTALAAKVTARPDMFAGPYSSLELALAAIEANTPKTTHIPRPDESE